MDVSEREGRATAQTCQAAAELVATQTCAQLETLVGLRSVPVGMQKQVNERGELGEEFFATLDFHGPIDAATRGE